MVGKENRPEHLLYRRSASVTNSKSERSVVEGDDEMVDVDLQSERAAMLNAAKPARRSSFLQVLAKKTTGLWKLPTLIKQRFSSSSAKSSASTSKSSFLSSGDSIPMTPIPLNHYHKGDQGCKKGDNQRVETWKGDQELIAQHRFIFHPSFAARYRLHRSIGEGSFGFVWRGERIFDGHAVAVKFIRRAKIPDGGWVWDMDVGRKVPSEVFFLRRLRHPNISRYIEHFDDIDYVYLVTDYFGVSWTLPSTLLAQQRNSLKTPDDFRRKQRPPFCDAPVDLFECIEAHVALPATVIRHILRQVVAAIQYIHREGFIHRDIKDENILINEHYDIQLADFGSCSFLPTNEYSGQFSKFSGTFSFAAPEVSAGTTGRYNALKAESWTVGVLLYTMAFKRPPYASSQAALISTLVIPSNSTHSRELEMIDLMRRLLEKDPSERMAISGILSHPWMAM